MKKKKIITTILETFNIYFDLYNYKYEMLCTSYDIYLVHLFHDVYADWENNHVLEQINYTIAFKF